MTESWNFDLYIDGTWTAGEADGTIEVVNPANEEVIGTVPEASSKDAVRAIEAARRAFDEGPWPYTKPSERAAALVRMAEYLESHAAELRELIVAETGSVGYLTDYVQAGGSIGMFRANATQIEHVLEWVEAGAPTAGPNGMIGSALFREPVGVVGAITPFNFPFMLNVVKVAPALAAGCTVVLKPHPWTPLDAFLIARAAEQADIPPGVLNVITGHGERGRRADVESHGGHDRLHRFDGNREAYHRQWGVDREAVPARARRKERTGAPRRCFRRPRTVHWLRVHADPLRPGMHPGYPAAPP